MAETSVPPVASPDTTDAERRLDPHAPDRERPYYITPSSDRERPPSLSPEAATTLASSLALPSLSPTDAALAAPPAPRVSWAGKIWSLQYVRAIAAIGVIAYHLVVGFAIRIPAGLTLVGLDLFFVLSGFLIVWFTSRLPVTPGQFLADRVSRIVPIYWIATFLAFAIATWTDHGWPGDSGRVSLLVRSLLFIPAWNGHGLLWPTLVVGWTLNDEAFFYGVFAVLVLLRRPLHRLIALTVLLVGLVAAGQMTHTHSAVLISYSNPMMLQFLAGAWLAHAFAALDAGRIDARRLGVLVLGMAAAFVFLYPLPWTDCGWLPVLVIAAALWFERNGQVPRITAIKTIGDASYSLYLFHLIGFKVADWLTVKGALVVGVATFPLWSRLSFSFSLAVAVGFLAHYTLEVPITRALRGAAGRRGQRARIAPTAAGV